MVKIFRVKKSRAVKMKTRNRSGDSPRNWQTRETGRTKNLTAFVMAAVAARPRS